MSICRRFKANYWNRPTKEDCELGVKRDEMPHSHKYIPKIHTKHGQTLPEFERQYSGTIAETDVEEVWFAGVHTGMSIISYCV